VHAAIPRRTVPTGGGGVETETLPPHLVVDQLERLVKHSKGHLRDSGLLHRLLHLANLDALLGHPQAGRSWEAMVSEEILRQLEWRGLDCGAFFYRT